MTLKGNIEINQPPTNHTYSHEWLVSKETAASRGWESEKPKLGIKRVDEGQISAVKGYNRRRFER